MTVRKFRDEHLIIVVLSSFMLFGARNIHTFILGKGVGEKGLFREVAGDVVLVTGAGHGMGR